MNATDTSLRSLHEQSIPFKMQIAESMCHQRLFALSQFIYVCLSLLSLINGLYSMFDDSSAWYILPETSIFLLAHIYTILYLYNIRHKSLPLIFSYRSKWGIFIILVTMLTDATRQALKDHGQTKQCRDCNGIVSLFSAFQRLTWWFMHMVFVIFADQIGCSYDYKPRSDINKQEQSTNRTGVNINDSITISSDESTSKLPPRQHTEIEQPNLKRKFMYGEKQGVRLYCLSNIIILTCFALIFVFYENEEELNFHRWISYCDLILIIKACYFLVEKYGRKFFWYNERINDNVTICVFDPSVQTMNTGAVHHAPKKVYGRLKRDSASARLMDGL